MSKVLTVSDLSVSIGRRSIVENVSFDVEEGGTLGIVGESGSGKSMTVLAATGLLDAPASHVSGSSRMGDLELVGAGPKALRSVHGSRVGFVFQDPSTSLNPLLTLERQITEPLQAHRRMTRRSARTRALELLEAVGIPDPESRLGAYPHQLSGGQRQRVMIAIGIACDPALLVADEPTTALDVTTEAQILELVRDLQEQRGTAVVWISHDLGVIGQLADDVAVLKQGAIVEHRPIVDVFSTPEHDYTRTLLDARPIVGRFTPPTTDEDAPTVLEVEHLDVHYPIVTPQGRSTVHAVKDVSFSVKRGHTLGIVGESGSGKSTIASALTGLVAPSGGTAVLTAGHEDDAPVEHDVLAAKGKAAAPVKRRLAMVFQDPFSSLDPRRSVADAIGEPLMVHRLTAPGAARRSRVEELLELVGLSTEFADRFPHELSGGQRQRVSIARALALEPDVLILDEATASLDVSIQALVLDLMRRLQDELGLTYLFIAHDLAIVHQMSHEVLVLRGGVAVEHRPTEELFASPREDYTKALLAAIPPERPRAAQSQAQSQAPSQAQFQAPAE
ncbi:ABC transporter ATP-binding protein [Demequina sp. NBRC 110054]|uniref:ABC transporter ATP-binding protein n=1 Tax=Demequina sp. NBRC 110054 TaxID=1570343 RepID=UPI000A033F7F|nr:ABC transporter ATP-binding protein [Demequina sp. NBRC 110054]